MFSDIIILLREAVANTVCGLDRFFALRQKQSSSCQIGHSLAIFNNVFDEDSNSVCLSERLPNLIIVSDEHWKNDEISFQNVNGHRESVN